MLDENTIQKLCLAERDTEDALQLIRALRRNPQTERPEAYLMNINGYLQNSVDYIDKIKK